MGAPLSKMECGTARSRQVQIVTQPAAKAMTPTIAPATETTKMTSSRGENSRLRSDQEPRRVHVFTALHTGSAAVMAIPAADGA